MLRVLGFLIIMSAFVPGPAFAYHPADAGGETRPYDAKLKHSAVMKLPEEGMNFVAEQLQAGLQESSLRRTIVEALEGQYFEVVLPIFGGILKLTIPCGKLNQFKADSYANGPWCRYLRGQPVRDDQVGLPTLETLDDGFRYEKVVVNASTFPIADLAPPEPHSLFASLELLEQAGKRAQLDMVPDHPMFKFVVPVISIENEQPVIDYTCFNLLGDGAGDDNGCEATFVATLEAELITGGQLRPYFEDNVLYVLVNNFETRLTDLEVLTPLTDAGNSGLIAALDICIDADLPGVSEGCVAQKETALQLLDTVEKALGDAAIDFFERELNAALSGVLEDGINQLMFDKEKDGTPDPVLDIDSLAAGLAEASGRDFGFNFDARYTAKPTNPVEAFIRLDGGLFADEFDACAGVESSPEFHYTNLELDGNVGHDPPQLGATLPGKTKPYQIGLAFSDDFINQLVYNIWATGMLCATIDPTGDDVPEELAELLNTDTFTPFAPWLPEFAPGAPVVIQVIPRDAPYVSLGDQGDGSLLRIHMHDVLLNVLVKVGEAESRTVRAFGIAANITAAVDVNGLNFDEAPLIDLAVDFESTSSVAFNDLRPEENESVASLLPPVLSLVAPTVSELVGNLELPLFSDCIGGLEQEDLVMHSFGHDPVAGVDNYLGIYMNFRGRLNFNKIITECLSVFGGEEEAAPPSFEPVSAEAIGLITAVSRAEARINAALAPEKPYTVRTDGGFWSRPKQGDLVLPALLDGGHTVEVRQGGDTHRWRFVLDRAAPIVRIEQEGSLVTARVSDLHPVTIRVNGGAEVSTNEWSARLRPGRHRLLIEAEDAAGQRSRVVQTVVVREGGAGCATGSPVPYVALLLAGAFVVRRRNRLLS